MGRGCVKGKLLNIRSKTSRYDQYLTHANCHITRGVAAMASCFVLVRTHQHGIAAGNEGHDSFPNVKQPRFLLKW